LFSAEILHYLAEISATRQQLVGVRTGKSSQTERWLMSVMFPSGILLFFLARGAMSRNSSVYS
jgi:hypothetical protein